MNPAIDTTTGSVVLTLAVIDRHQSERHARTAINRELQDLKHHAHVSVCAFKTENHFENYRHSLTVKVTLKTTRDLLALARWIAVRKVK